MILAELESHPHPFIRPRVHVYPHSENTRLSGAHTLDVDVRVVLQSLEGFDRVGVLAEDAKIYRPEGSRTYVLELDGEQHRAVVAHRGAETQVQVTDGAEPVTIDWEFALGGRAVSVRIGGVDDADGAEGFRLIASGRPVSPPVLIAGSSGTSLRGY